MKNNLIILCFLVLSNTLQAQRWSLAFVGKPESRALYASNVAKAIQVAWENELLSKGKKEMLLDEIIFGQEVDKKSNIDLDVPKSISTNIDEIEEVLGIEEQIDPVKKNKTAEKTNTSSTVSKSTPAKSEIKIQDTDEENTVIVKKLDVPITSENSTTTIAIQREEVEIDTIYAIPQVLPMFPGGNNAMKQFFSKNIQTPQSTGTPVKGKVFVRFMVDKKGKLSRIYLVKGLTDACNQEALRVVKRMPEWIPATQEGDPVNAWHTLPIYFEIE
ncbi:MAG: energy transducer TonB [Arcicella sp.]|jgi:TonB family protein|nr:energy transducer TonB [Arcicella sp.]